MFPILSLILCSGCSNPFDDQALLEKKINSEQGELFCSPCESDFWLKDFSHSHMDGPNELFRIEASEMSYQPRKGKLIKFDSYREIIFKNLIVKQTINSGTVKLHTDEFSNLTDLKDTLTSSQPKFGPEKAQDKLLGSRLNRIIIDNITIHFTSDKKPPITIRSENATLLLDSMSMLLIDNVIVEAAHCKIHADRAIWSNILGGLLFSEKFILNNRKYTQISFVQIMSPGRCKFLKPTPKIAFEDTLGIIEDKLIKSLPVSIQLLFGLRINKLMPAE